MLLIAAVCLVPLVMAMYLRFISPPGGQMIVGEALVPFAFPYDALQLRGGQTASSAAAVSEHWLVVQWGRGPCDQACSDALYLSRQARTAQGRAMDRVQRLWISLDATPLSGELRMAHPDLQELLPATAKDAQQLSQQFMVQSNLPHLYLVDRRGNVVFRYPASVKPQEFIRELGKLVKF